MINLTENGGILSSDTDIADTFNDYFSNVVQNLNTPNENLILNTDLCIKLVLQLSRNASIIKLSFLPIKNLDKKASLNLVFIFSL